MWRIVFAFCALYVASASDATSLQESPLSTVYAVVGSRAFLPCDVRPSDQLDDAILVLVYKWPIKTPVYSVDYRAGRPIRWANDSVLTSRANFELDEVSGLSLNPLMSTDESLYRCRVDFRSSPTKNVRIDLQVVGKPVPNVTWRDKNFILTSDLRYSEEGTTSSLLRILPVTREDLFKVLSCQASNFNDSKPLSSSVTLDVTYSPTSVKILGATKVWSENETYEVVCEAIDGRPPAEVTWKMNNADLLDVKNAVLNKGNVTRSTLFFTPTYADDGAVLSCLAKSPMTSEAMLRDSRKLHIFYTPRLSLSAGHSLDMNDIKEGDDVYFECRIQANPPVFKVVWFHNGKEVVQNISAGVIQTNQSLVLQKVQRQSSGDYTCAATNIQDTGTSNPVSLRVKFIPVCQDNQKIVYGSGKGESVNVTCSIEAHPPPTSFKWAFNSSSDIVDLISNRHRLMNQKVSQVTYTPRDHLDYGSLLCWAVNDVGRQIQPCVFHLLHATIPEPVNNCTVDNVTSSSAAVQCQSGWDGGLAQTFTLSVSHARAHTRGHDKSGSEGSPKVLANTSSSPRPEFVLTGLEPGTEYVLTISAVNKKGYSQPMRLAIFTPKDLAEKRTSKESSALSLAPILAVLLGVCLSLFLMALVAVFVVRSRRSPKPKGTITVLYEETATETRRDGDVISGDEPNPDVIPNTLILEGQRQYYDVTFEKSSPRGLIEHKIQDDETRGRYLQDNFQEQDPAMLSQSFPPHLPSSNYPIIPDYQFPSFAQPSEPLEGGFLASVTPLGYSTLSRRSKVNYLTESKNQEISCTLPRRNFSASSLRVNLVSGTDKGYLKPFQAPVTVGSKDQNGHRESSV